MTSYRVYITFDESEDVLTGVLGKEGLALSMASTTQFFQDESSDFDSYITSMEMSQVYLVEKTHSRPSTLANL